MSVPRLHPDDLRELARLIAAELVEAQAAPGAPEYVDANEIARRFKISRDTVYEHARDFGAARIGDGPRARLRFDPAKVSAALGVHDQPVPEPASTPGRRRRRAKTTSSSGVPLLPIHTPKE